MKYPTWSCHRCGERPFGHIDGGFICHNCRTCTPLADTARPGVELRYDAAADADSGRASRPQPSAE